MLAFEVGDHPVHLVENRSLLFLHERGAHGLKLGLSGLRARRRAYSSRGRAFRESSRWLSPALYLRRGRNACRQSARNGEPSHFDTMPSRPILQAWRKTNSPSWEGGRQRRVSSARRCLKAAVFSTMARPVGVRAVAQVTMYPFLSRATPICSQAAVIADIGGCLKSACWRTAAPRGSRNGYGMSGLHSALMPANLTTLRHLSISSAINFPKSAGEPANIAAPRSVRRFFMLESTRAALISLLSFSTISVGVALGTAIPYQPLASKPGRNSPTVGTSGKGS